MFVIPVVGQFNDKTVSVQLKDGPNSFEIQGVGMK
jgi:hypothetical protein